MKRTLCLLILILSGFAHCYAQNALPPTGNVGIGTASPGSALTIIRGATGVSIEPGAFPYYGSLAFNRESAIGTIFDPKGFAYQINNGGTDKNLHFQVWNQSGSLVTNDAIVVATNGFVGIGTASPAEALSVNGNIRSKEIKVETSNWPDYVFKPDYGLLSLKEVKAYIDENQHLPDMPSAERVSKEGLSLGEMNKLLTKKVEELTLYLIQLKEENEKRSNEDQIRFKALESKIESLSKK